MEKFATDLDKLLDEFENEDISSNNIYECSDSSGYNSLKTSTELYPADLPIECTSSQFSEMNDIAELPTPTCDETDFTMSLTNAFQSPVVSESDIIQNESFVGVENIIEPSIISSTDKTEISVSVTSPTNDISIIDPNINISEPTVSPVSHVPPKKKLRPSSLFNVAEITRSEQPSSNEGSADNQLQLNSNSNSINSFESPETTSSTKKSIKRPLSLNLMSPGHNSVNNIPNIRINDDNQITTMSSSLYSEPSAAVDISELKNDEEVLKVTETNDANVWQGIPLEELGQREPEWIKDDLKNNCMQCQLPFTMFRRRHHCRACGRLLCGKCCCWRMQLQFSNRFFPKDRVCAVCFQYLIRIEVAKKHKPNSTISNMNQNNSVLKSLSRPLSLAISPVSNSDNLSFSDSLNNSSQSKSVTFSDGIRPGGDLSEIEKSRIITPTKYQSQSKSVAYDSLNTSNSREPSFINQEDFVSSLPPLVIEHRNELIINLNSENVAQQTKTIENNPIILAITKNLHIHMEIIQLTSYACTHNQVCGDNIEEEGQCNCNEFWYFASVGLETIGCEEVVIVLKRLPKENCPPIEIFHYYFQIYQRAHKNETKYDCLEMTVELFPKTNIRLKDWAGIFHIRPTFQCLDKLPLPRSSFLIGILIHRWELPWAKILPLRLILALGNQSRYYPCSIVSDRNRSTVYEEISQTILQIINPVFSFAKNFEEGFLEPNLLPTIPGMWIHLLASQETIIQIPKLSYHSVLNILSYRQSECSTLALVACFSREADSHLVCCQNEDTCKYYSGAISILNTERTVTGATMIIFVPCDNSVEYGATIVEDVLVVRLSLIQLSCVVNSLKTLSNLILQWDSSLAQTNKKLESSTQNNKSIVSRSFIKIVWTDNHQFSEMAFIERPSLVTDETLQSAFLNTTCEENVTLKSYRVPSSLQILSPEQNTFNLNLKIVWTRFHYYFLDKIFKESLNEEPLDVDDMIRRIAVCFSQSIDKYLDLLREMGLVNIGLRITLEKNNVSFLVGCSKKNIYSTITPDQSPSDEPDSNQSSYAYFRMGYPRKFQTLSICTLPDICIESLNDTLVPFLYSLTEQILDNSITSELEFHIID